MKIQSFLLAATAGLAITGAAHAATITGTFASGLAGITSSTPGIAVGSVLTTSAGFVTGTTDDFTPVPLFTLLNFSAITATNGTPVSFTSSFGSFTGIISGLVTTPASNATVNFTSLGTFTPSGTLSGFTAGDALLTVGFTQTGRLVTGQTAPAISGNFTFASAAVPEPASWAMLVMGFGLVGVATRRRQAVVTA